MTRSTALLATLCAALAWLPAPSLTAQENKNWRTAPTGYSDTPVLPGQKWKVHDIDRPKPPVVSPGARPGDAPSDAIVLFDGQDLSRWETRNRQGVRPAGWKVENGYMEVTPGAGSIMTKEKFGDVQLHLEFMTPTTPSGTSQWRSNSGVIFMNRYELQVLDSYENPTYADGQAGSIYGQWPPLVNASRKPGEWQAYDVVFEAPRFDTAGKVARPAYYTVFHNGVMVHNRQEAIGQMAHKVVSPYVAHGPEEPLQLQDHDVPVRFRNIWIRRLKGYDGQPR
jgi:hypothetical protein